MEGIHKQNAITYSDIRSRKSLVWQYISLV